MAPVIMPRPSSAGRWASFNGCPGSVQLEAEFPNQESESAKEGTAAHDLLERYITSRHDPFGYVDTPMTNGILATSEMAEYVVDFGAHLLKIAPFDDWVCEQRIQIPRVRSDQGGTPDLYHYNPATGILTLPDLKFGYGIVEAVENWQLMNYAIGLVDLYPDTQAIIIAIYQPRVPHPQGHFRLWQITRQELENYVPQFQQTAQLSAIENAPIRTGPHCRDCAALCRCPAARQASLNAIEVSDIAVLDDYDGQTMANEKELLDAALRAIKTRKEAIDTLIEQEIKSGVIVPGYMVMRSFGHLKWNKDFTLEKIKALGKLTGVKLINEKPVTPTQAKNAGVPKRIMEGLQHKPETGLKLVRANASKEAERIFGK